jgi:hypothetical protein
VSDCPIAKRAGLALQVAETSGVIKRSSHVDLPPVGGIELHVSEVDTLENSRVTIWNDTLNERELWLREHAIWVEPTLNAVLKLAEGSLEVLLDPTGKALVYPCVPWKLLRNLSAEGAGQHQSE